jgi:transcriptional regulator with GAF, ATPase, and Fis domain
MLRVGEAVDRGAELRARQGEGFEDVANVSKTRDGTVAPHDLLVFIARRVIEDEGEADALAAEVAGWVERNLGRDYPWPGNFRELEQCVRNVMIRQAYQPVQTLARAVPEEPRQALAAAVVEGTLTARELERRYFTLVYAQCGNYQEAARRLRCNWRTLRGKIDRAFLRKLTPGKSGPLH